MREFIEGLRALLAGDYEQDFASADEGELAELGRALVELRDMLAARERSDRLLAELSEKITAGFALDEVLEYLFESFRAVVPYDRIGLALLEQDEEPVVRAYWVCTSLGETEFPRNYSRLLSKTSLGQVLLTKKFFLPLQNCVTM